MKISPKKTHCKLQLSRNTVLIRAHACTLIRCSLVLSNLYNSKPQIYLRRVLYLTQLKIYLSCLAGLPEFTLGVFSHSPQRLYRWQPQSDNSRWSSSDCNYSENLLLLSSVVNEHARHFVQTGLEECGVFGCYLSFSQQGLQSGSKEAAVRARANMQQPRS